MDLWEVVIRLGVASLLGSLIGLERESHGRPAGLRTHTLVAVGSALIMMVSIHVALDYGAGGANSDTTRIAAQVVSGIGFLGAGTILREGINIRGLTTAATLWVVSALGLASGAGYYVAATVVTVLTLMTLIVLSRLERTYLRASHRYCELHVEVDDRPGALGDIASQLGSYKANVKSVALEPSSRSQRVEIRMVVQLDPGMSPSQLLTLLLANDHVHQAELV